MMTDGNNVPSRELELSWYLDSQHSLGSAANDSAELKSLYNFEKVSQMNHSLKPAQVVDQNHNPNWGHACLHIHSSSRELNVYNK